MSRACEAFLRVKNQSQPAKSALCVKSRRLCRVPSSSSVVIIAMRTSRMTSPNQRTLASRSSFIAEPSTQGRFRKAECHTCSQEAGLDSRGSRRRARKGEREHAALAQAALDDDGATLQLNETTRDREAKAWAVAGLSALVRLAVEHLAV